MEVRYSTGWRAYSRARQDMTRCASATRGLYCQTADLFAAAERGLLIEIRKPLANRRRKHEQFAALVGECGEITAACSGKLVECPVKPAREISSDVIVAMPLRRADRPIQNTRKSVTVFNLACAASFTLGSCHSKILES